MSKSYKPVLNNGKFYTGYQHDIGKRNNAKHVDCEHEEQFLRLLYDGCAKGRSSVVFYLLGGDGYRYEISLKTMNDIITNRFDSLKPITGGFQIACYFEQVKQGKSYFIKPVCKEGK